MFITFEGIDGCGKTTQVDLLCRYLRSKSKPVLRTSEPSSDSIDVRSCVLHGTVDLDPVATFLLFASDRAQHTINVISPALQKGAIVVCDRFIHSSIAYQGYGQNVNLDFIANVNKVVTTNVKPDITFFIDTPIETALDRIKKPDCIEQNDRAFYERVRNGFLCLSISEAEVYRIDGDRDMETIANEIKTIVDKQLQRKLTQ